METGVQFPVAQLFVFFLARPGRSSVFLHGRSSYARQTVRGGGGSGRPSARGSAGGTEKGVRNTMSDVVAWGLGSAWLALMGENSDENRRATDQIVQSLTARVNQTVEPSLSTCDELVSNIIQRRFMNLRLLMPYIRNSSEFSEFSVDPNRIDHNHHLSPGNTGFMCYEVQCAIV